MRNLCLTVLLLLALMPPGAQAQQTNVLGLQGIVGVNQVVRGHFVQVYTVQLEDGNNANTVCELGYAGNTGIQVTVSDLSTPTSLQSSDIVSLNLYYSADAVYDAGDTFIDTQPVTIGGLVQFDATGAGAVRTIPDAGPFPFFVILANISSTARLGAAFRLGAAANHIGIDETNLFPPGVDGGVGGQILADDANHVVIGDVAMSGGRPVSIPFGGEAAIVVLMIATGAYALRNTVRIHPHT